MMTTTDRETLRDLARRVSEISSDPVMDERKALWKKHNSLRRVRPLILIFPEGSWRELLPETALKCENEKARQIELALRRRIYYYEHFSDDTVIERIWNVQKTINSTGWGLEPKRIPSPDKHGSWMFDPVIKGSDDIKKIRHPEISFDDIETQKNLTAAQELFGDILDVRLVGVQHISYHLPAQYSYWRGLENMMLDMVDNPQMLLDALHILEEGQRRILEQYVSLNLLSLNNDNTYNNSGGNSWTDELPADGFDPAHIRPKDMWASAEAQELAGVSPRMHDRFALDFEKRLLEPFGLTGYGCCEDLTNKLDRVFRIPNIRRISISPFANVDACAEKLEGNYIFSWKPQPSHLCGGFNELFIRDYIKHTLDVAKDCVLEIILKDTHTCENKPERFDRWSKIARELVEDKRDA
ncbi:MAG: hypothetical protein ABIH86_01005 [Planctomycetota bacterium]